MHRLRSNRMTIVAVAAVIAAGAWPACAAAHHSFAMYDQAQVKTLTGKLTRYIPGANHAQMIFELLEADGTPVARRRRQARALGSRDGPGGAHRAARRDARRTSRPARS